MSLNGKVGYNEIADLFTMVESARHSGVLTLVSGRETARLYFEWGELIRAESTKSPERLGQLLVEFGALSPGELDEALAVQLADEEERRLGNLLACDFGVTEDDIQRALAFQFKAIVTDLLSWPGATFTFDSKLPAGVSDRFTLNASEYLMEVGIETGLLVEENRTRPTTA